jgi:hypothetical protein
MGVTSKAAMTRVSAMLAEGVYILSYTLHFFDILRAFHRSSSIRALDRTMTVSRLWTGTERSEGRFALMHGDCIIF